MTPSCGRVEEHFEIQQGTRNCTCDSKAMRSLHQNYAGGPSVSGFYGVRHILLNLNVVPLPLAPTHNTLHLYRVFKEWMLSRMGRKWITSGRNVEY